jgi:hypothetical protein
MLTAGLDVLPAAPRVGYEVDDQFVPTVVIWRLQPTFGLGVALRTGHGL